MSPPTTAERLGYAAEARLLIVNADDFGMCEAENSATIAGLQENAFDSTTLMVPCPWFEAAAELVRKNPHVDAGVHITHTSEWQTFKWGPICGRGGAASLVDARGYFRATVPELYAHADAADIERETRAQIDRAIAAGIDVTHLDSHMGTLQLDADYHALYLRLAAEYRLPVRMMSPSHLHDLGFSEMVALADQLQVLHPDRLWIGGPPQPATTASYWIDMLQSLRPGITELYVHAAHDTPEIRSITPDWQQRVADFDFFTAASTRRLLDELGIIRIGYRQLRNLQRGQAAC